MVCFEAQFSQLTKSQSYSANYLNHCSYKNVSGKVAQSLGVTSSKFKSASLIRFIHQEG